MGILAAVVVFAVGGFTSTSAAAACKTDAASVQTAQQAYYAANSSYATSTSALVPTYLKALPSTTHYTIGIATVAGTPSGASVGDVTVTPTGTGATTTDWTTTPSTACNGVS